jgi:tetratricopeptide (TPR) repeat protein
MPDGPGKTIWGIEQWLWLLRSLGESDATYKVILSPTAIVGPDADPFSKRGDNHADIDRAYEGDEIRRLLARHENLVVIAGDLHYQYMSIDPNTGLREYGCGPASDAHTTGGVQYTSVDPRSGRREHGPWTDDNSSPDGPRARHRDEYHRYRNPVGGFVSATVDPDTEVTRLVLRFHATGGDVLYEDALESTSGRRSDLADDHLAAQAEWDRAVALAEAAAVSRDSAQARAMLSERLGAVRRLARWTGKRQHRVWLAQSLRGLDQHHESVAIMAHAVRDDPTGARVLIALGDAYRTEGQSDIAALAYRAALHRRDVSAAEALTIGDLFHAVDYWRWSIRAYRKALRQPPPLEGADLEKAHRNLAWDLFREGDVTEAIEHWRVTEGIRSTAQSAYSLAYAYLWIGEADSARALYRRAVTSFGAEKGARLGAVDHLNLLIRKDMQADVARSILHEHWGQPNSRSSGSAASP